MKSVRNLHSRGDFIEIGREGLVLKGAWTIRTVSALNKILRKIGPKKRSLPADATKIEELDTAGVWVIGKYFPDIRLTPEQQALFDFMSFSGYAGKKLKKPGFFVMLGMGFCGVLDFIYGISCFVGMIAIRLLKNIFNPRHFRIPSIVRHIDESGLHAVPIIGFMAVGISAVISYQASIQLRKFGADIFTIDLTVISLLREMAVLVTSIMLAGRSGSAFAAEIGVMKLRGEVDALQVMGFDPVETLVLPRLLALLLSLPLLTFVADIVGLAGGGIISFTLLDISWTQYLDRVRGVATPTMFFVGMIKAPVFAFLIAAICTYQGISVSGSAENVGRVTTTAVVQSIFMVLMTDALFSIIFSKMEI